MRLLYNFGELSTDRITIFRIRERPWLLHRFRKLALCREDREELKKTNPELSVEEHLDYCIRQENTYGVLFDGVPELLFGFAPFHGDIIPWLLSTGVIQKKCPKEFLRLAGRIVRKVRETGILMFNCVPVDTTRDTRWLERLGFSFDLPCTLSSGTRVKVFWMNRGEEKNGN